MTYTKMAQSFLKLGGLLALLGMLVACGGNTAVSSPPTPIPLVTATPATTGQLPPTPTLNAVLQPVATQTAAEATAVAALPTVAVVAPDTGPVADPPRTIETNPESASTTETTSSSEPRPLGITPTPAPDLPPAERLAVAERAFFNGDSQRTASELTTALESGELTGEQESAALYLLGQAQADMGQIDTAVETFRAHLDSNAPNPRAHFFLGELNQQAGNCPTAISEYEAYLAAQPSMGAYVYPRIADCLENTADITAIYEQALNAPAHYLVEISLRRQLATRQLNASNFAAAIAQYERIRDLAQTEFTKGEMTYLIGTTYAQAGDLPNAYTAYQFGITNYPRAYESYLGLVQLVNAEQPVNEYQRGLVNFHAKSYQPSLEAFQRYLAANLTDYQPDTHLYLAWVYEALGDADNALLHLDKYLTVNPTDSATIGRYYTEKAELENRVVSTAVALTTLDQFITQHPDHSQIADARWRAAQFADRFEGNAVTGAQRYRRFAEQHPNHGNAAQAWFRAGVLAQQLGQLPDAVEAWQMATTYQYSEFAHAALLWLVTNLPAEEAQAYNAQISALLPLDYYAIRARDLVAGVPAYTPPARWNVTDFDEAAEQAEVEAWLRATFPLGENTAVGSTLDPTLANDPRLIRGTELWELGLKVEAKQELETLRIAYDKDPVASYQLALYFRDLGLYRSSIIAGSTVRWLAGATVYNAPRLLGRLAFPTYYADLITPSAERYGYDPLLHFALIRQESLFESFITSHAAAQGLGQVIPATGEFIAQRIQWPNYRNEDLFRPHINLIFASYYLDQQLAAFEGNKAAALSAYNAGPGNAQRWATTAGDNHDQYLETVDFAETRDYIRRIYEWHAAYKYLYSAE